MRWDGWLGCKESSITVVPSQVLPGRISITVVPRRVSVLPGRISITVVPRRISRLNIWRTRIILSWHSLPWWWRWQWRWRWWWRRWWWWRLNGRWPSDQDAQLGMTMVTSGKLERGPGPRYSIIFPKTVIFSKHEPFLIWFLFSLQCFHLFWYGLFSHLFWNSLRCRPTAVQ